MARRGDDYDDGFYTTGAGVPPSRRGRPVNDGFFDESDIRRERSRSRVRVREREDVDSRLPNFMRDDRRGEGGGPTGPLVLRKREVETLSRSRSRSRSRTRGGRSPSPVVRFHEERVVRRRRSLTSPPPPPPPVQVRERVVFERERPPRSPSRERLVTTRVVGRRTSSPSPHAAANVERTRTRIVERGRGRSPSPERVRSRSRSRIRIVEHEVSRERIPSPSPSPPPPPPPQFIRGPTIEREVITHYRDIDHGVIQARQPSPPRRVRSRSRVRERDTEIDISTSRDRTDVDIRETRRRRSPSVERMSGALVVSKPRPSTPLQSILKREKVYVEDDMDVVVEDSRHRLRVDIEDRGHHHHRSTSVSREHSHSGPHRRAHSAMPPSSRLDYSDEAEEITSRINARGRMGEAHHGVTRDWTIVDVPPGTERVQMDGVGGGGAEVTWQRYNGVRRAKFIPERDDGGGALVVAGPSSSSTTTTTVSSSSDNRAGDRDRLNVSVVDRHHDIEIEKSSGGGRGRRERPRRVTEDMWTEITKDLVIRDAIEEMGYEYEETEFFYYVMRYLRYEDVLELVQLSDEIRRHRRRHLREIEWERDHHHHHHHHSGSESRHRHRRSKYDDEVVVDHEVVYERPIRGYLR